MSDFLVVNSVVIPVAWPDGAESPVEEIGDSGRAFLGNMLSSVRARKSTWPVRTRPLTLTERGTLRTALESTPPVACSGDLLGGSVSCTVVILSDNVITIAGGARRRVIRFELHQV